MAESIEALGTEPNDDTWEIIEDAAAEQIAEQAWMGAVDAATFSQDNKAMVKVGVVGNIIEQVVTLLVRRLRDDGEQRT